MGAVSLRKRHNGRVRGRSLRLYAAFALALLYLWVSLAWPTAAAWAQAAHTVADLARRPEFKEPVVLTSKDGVLEVRLKGRQGEATLDTVAKPVKNFLLFDYEVIQGTASDGKKSGGNLYPAPTLRLFPGERLIVHFENGLSDLTIRDYFDPQYTPKGAVVPTYPPPLTSSPMNLHTHGAHISPKGNADNVMLHIPPGMSNTYVYDMPRNMPQGLFWYHCHLHGLTSAQVYTGLVGLLQVGRTDGNIPIVTDNKIPIRNMALQYNFVFDRAGGMAQLNNPNWPQWVSTLTPPKEGELAAGKYPASLAPVNFRESRLGTKYPTVWYAGPLSIANNRGQLEMIPSNLQSFTAADRTAGGDLPANPSLPDYQRDMQFTVNGQFQPIIKSKAGQTEIWVLANVSDFAYMNLQLTETATGDHPKFAIVAQDGNPYTAVHYPPTDNGTRLVIPPASRFAIAVTIPAEGDLVLEMAQRSSDAKGVTSPGVLYTNNGTDTPPGILGTLTVPASAISYADGFFIFPTQVLLRAKATQPGGVTTAFVEGQKLGAYTSFVDLSKSAPDVKRKILISGGFLNTLADPNDPKSFTYAFDGRAFPNMPLIQPRLNSVEEWNIVNNNNDEHPIHVHVNDFQVSEYADPVTGLHTGPDQFSIDNANAPAPKLGPNESVIAPGILSIRTRFDEYTGLYVMHCHRLNHEDNGLMALVNVIPAVSAYAVGVPGAPGRAAEVRVYDGKDDRLIGTIIPFPGYEGDVNVAMGDLDGDGILDLIVGAGEDHPADVIVYAGASIRGKGMFGTELARFQPFGPNLRSGVSVSAAQIDGSQADNLIVGSGPGIASQVKIYSIPLAVFAGAGPKLFASFEPYGEDLSGVKVASGFVDFATGRDSIVTAPGRGTPAEIKVFAFTLLQPNSKDAHATAHASPTNSPVKLSSFFPFGQDYRDGVSLCTGWLAGSLGGAKRIVTSQLTGRGTVKIFCGASALDGGPAMYLHNPLHHDHGANFREIASFQPFDHAGGVQVASTSTTNGANLVVSGGALGGKQVTVLKYDFVRPNAEATTVEPVRIGQVWSGNASAPATVGGD